MADVCPLAASLVQLCRLEREKTAVHYIDFVVHFCQHPYRRLTSKLWVINVFADLAGIWVVLGGVVRRGDSGRCKLLDVKVRPRLILEQITEPKMRARAMSYFLLGPQIGPVLGPVIGGVLTREASWRWIFGFLGRAYWRSHSCAFLD